jgi:hypothetical protein
LQKRGFLDIGGKQHRLHFLGGLPIAMIENFDIDEPRMVIIPVAWTAMPPMPIQD